MDDSGVLHPNERCKSAITNSDMKAAFQSVRFIASLTISAVHHS